MRVEYSQQTNRSLVGFLNTLAQKLSPVAINPPDAAHLQGGWEEDAIKQKGKKNCWPDRPVMEIVVIHEQKAGGT